MATLNTSQSPNQNPREERKVAGILFLAILGAIAAALAVYFVASNFEPLNPYKANRPGSTAPDVNTQSPGDRSGAVAAPQSENVPEPASKPKPQRK